MKPVSPHHRQLYLQNTKSKQRRLQRIRPVLAQSLNGQANSPLSQDTNEPMAAKKLTVRPVVTPSPLGTTSPVMAATTEKPEKQAAAPVKKQLVKINVTNDRVVKRRARAFERLTGDIATRMKRDNGSETKIGRFRFCEVGRTTVINEDGTERTVIRRRWVKVTEPKITEFKVTEPKVSEPEETSCTEPSDASTQ